MHVPANIVDPDAVSEETPEDGKPAIAGLQLAPLSVDTKTLLGEPAKRVESRTPIAITRTPVNPDTLPAGSYTINFDAATLATGVSFYRLESGGTSEVKKMHYLK